jgi:membrane protease YdiL (CAAX protease family)
MAQPPQIPNQFAFTAAAFEGSLVAVSIVLGWAFQLKPLQTFHPDLRDLGISIVATLPPLVLFWLCLKVPLPPLKRIVDILDETIVPLFRDCDFPQFAIIALLAGMGEEMLFRGIVQVSIAQEFPEPYGPWIGLGVAAVLFGLLHLVTPTYAVMATLIGLYLGWLWLAIGNLLVPITVHTIYDFCALVYLVKVRKPEEKPKDGNAQDTGDGENNGS